MREVKTCIALTKRDYSGWLFQLVYMYISSNLIAVLGPLAICLFTLCSIICLTRHVPFKDMRRSIIFQQGIWASTIVVCKTRP